MAAAAGSSSRSPIVISDDEAVVPPVVVKAASRRTAPSGAARSWRGRLAAAVGFGGHDDAEIERPDWLPDCFTVGVEKSCGDGTVILEYTCPAGFVFNSRSQVLDHCNSGALQRALAAQATLDDMNTLQGKYHWLRGYPGVVLEIRAGGENLSKMYKFYADLHKGVRVATKKEFMRYVDHAEVPKHNNEVCETRGEDNVIAQLDFLVRDLPPGWVKETAFRKRGTGIRKDTFYTDPVNQKIYRSLKAAIESYKTGTSKGSYNPNFSVTEKYLFDNGADMLPCLAERLKINASEHHECNKAGRSSHRKKDGASTSSEQPKGKGNKAKAEKKRDKDAMTAPDTGKPSRPRGRPRKS